MITTTTSAPSKGLKPLFDRILVKKVIEKGTGESVTKGGIYIPKDMNDNSGGLCKVQVRLDIRNGHTRAVTHPYVTHLPSSFL